MAEKQFTTCSFIVALKFTVHWAAIWSVHYKKPIVICSKPNLIIMKVTERNNTWREKKTQNSNLIYLSDQSRMGA